jgi:hypothetical protein
MEYSSFNPVNLMRLEGIAKRERPFGENIFFKLTGLAADSEAVGRWVDCGIASGQAVH